MIDIAGMSGPERAADWLLSADAVRTQAGKVLAAGRAGDLTHFAVEDSRMAVTADFVADTIRQNYPGLDIPYHARWRHFVVDGEDRWQAFSSGLSLDPLERARTEIDLVIVSVLLDAGAGSSWTFKDREGRQFARSEGLAIASLEGFCNGAFSTSGSSAPICHAATLEDFTADQTADLFQVTPGNPLDGLEGRTALMRSLGHTCRTKPQFFGPCGRPGGLADYLLSRARDGTIGASAILKTVLAALGDIWPGRLTLAGRNLGDCWHHPAATADGSANGMIPFHKLSQWLSYSMVEPLQRLGLRVTGLDDLTGLAEYRNGGLLIDTGLLKLREPDELDRRHAPEEHLIVEWRALTVALLDEIAEQVRSRLDLDKERLPLASVLEGGTWAAGRRIAAQNRPSGGPPLNIVSDGSVF